MKKYFLAGLSLILVLAIGIVAYGAYLNQRGELQITMRMSERRLPLRGTRAEKRELYPRITVPSLNLYAAEMADAVALIDGRVTESLAERNEPVRKGQPVFIVVNESIPMKLREADGAILRAEAALRQAENTYKRYQMLREYDAVSAERFDAAQSEYAAAQAGLLEAKARKDDLLVMEGRQEVVAPLDGQILMQYRQVGSYVQAGTPLALVGDFSTLRFDMSMDGEAVDYLHVGQQANLVFNNRDFQKVYHTSFGAGNKGKEQEFTATVISVTPPLERPAKIRTVKWSLDNGAGLLEPQTYGGVTLRLSERHLCLALPLSAMTDNSYSAVFVVKEDGTIEKRAVQTGIDDGKYVEILSGLSGGEIVVTSGMKGLSEGAKVEIELE